MWGKTYGSPKTTIEWLTETIVHTTSPRQQPSCLTTLTQVSLFHWVILSSSPLPLLKGKEHAPFCQLPQMFCSLVQILLPKPSAHNFPSELFNIIHFVILSSNKTLDQIPVKSLTKPAVLAPADFGKQHKLTWLSQRAEPLLQSPRKALLLC